MCEPLQKLRLWPCKASLSPLVILYYSFQGDTSVVVYLFYVLESNFVYVLVLMFVLFAPDVRFIS